MDETTHKQTVKQTTTDALVELYCHVTELPDGPIKQRFLQRFEDMHPGTPPFIPRSKLTHASTPVKSMENTVSIMRPPLSPITGKNTAASTPAIKKRVAFDVVDSPASFSCKTPQYKATPFLSRLGIRTPSGMILPDESPVTNHKRTVVSSPGNFVSTRKHLKSAHTPMTPSGFISRTSVDLSCEESLTVTPSSVETQQSAPPQLKLRLSDVDHLMDEVYV